jgi:hypothetical protein
VKRQAYVPPADNSEERDYGQEKERKKRVLREVQKEKGQTLFRLPQGLIVRLVAAGGVTG